MSRRYSDGPTFPPVSAPSRILCFDAASEATEEGTTFVDTKSENLNAGYLRITDKSKQGNYDVMLLGGLKVRGDFVLIESEWLGVDVANAAYTTTLTTTIGLTPKKVDYARTDYMHRLYYFTQMDGVEVANILVIYYYGTVPAPGRRTYHLNCYSAFLKRLSAARERIVASGQKTRMIVIASDYAWYTYSVPGLNVFPGFKKLEKNISDVWYRRGYTDRRTLMTVFSNFTERTTYVTQPYVGVHFGEGDRGVFYEKLSEPSDNSLVLFDQDNTFMTYGEYKYWKSLGFPIKYRWDNQDRDTSWIPRYT